ncbi:MAG: putative lipid II flippase MurJ [Chlamydiales bacterium]|nr:putative lipid II flippase MurJ [Chlamydiales bacterium]MCH9619382.1 putative lipid II flippase MurJ [Chlamydiales bacterium]MCH9622186.1 putative lipid II flippase MurJ [Chlamydiales bacterium]
MNDSQLTIARSAKRFFTGTLISRFSGLGREVLMAVAFGTQPAVAAFWMAFRFSHLLRRVFGEGALHSAFVPHFESLRSEDPAKAARFFYDLYTSLLLLLLIIVVAVEGILGSVLYFGHPSLENRDVIELTMLLLPAIVFICLFALNNSLLNCEKSFFLPSVAPFFLNTVWIVAICFMWNTPVREAMQNLAMLLVFAFMLQWGVTLPRVLKELSHPHQEKMPILPILRPFLLCIFGVTATQINSALDTIFARIASSEGPAYLWYAIRLQQLPLALFGVGMAGALLPPLTRAIQSGDQEKTARFFRYAVSRTIALMLPITIGIFLLGNLSIKLVYGHGKFGDVAIAETTQCLWAYGLGLVPMSLVLILATTFFARKNYLIPTVASIGTVLLNVILNTLFVFVFHLGAASIAYATSISACVNGGVLFMFYVQGIRKQRED